MKRPQSCCPAIVFALVILVAFASGCGGDRAQIQPDDQLHVVDRSGWSTERQVLEERFKAALEAADQLARPGDPEELERITAEALDEHDAVRDQLENIVEQGEPEKSAWALLRIGQGFLSLGCNVARSPAPEELTAEQRETYRELLFEQAEVFVDNGLDLFDTVLEVGNDSSESDDGYLQNWTGKAEQWSETINDADRLIDACRGVTDAWQHGDGEERGFTEAHKRKCLDGHFSTCSRLFQREPYESGLRQVCRDNPGEELQGAELERWCLSEVVDPIVCEMLGAQPSGRELPDVEFNEEWASGLPTAEVTDPKELPTAEVLRLEPDEPYVLPCVGFGLQQRSSEERQAEAERRREHRQRQRERRREQCLQSGAPRECLLAAGTVSSADDALQFYLRGCEEGAETDELEQTIDQAARNTDRAAGNRNCREAARVKLASDNPEDVVEGKRVLDERCEIGDPRACMVLANYYRDATADMLQQFERACELNDPLGCRALAAELIDQQEYNELHEQIVETLQQHCRRRSTRNCDKLAYYFQTRGDGAHEQLCRMYFDVWGEL